MEFTDDERTTLSLALPVAADDWDKLAMFIRAHVRNGDGGTYFAELFETQAQKARALLVKIAGDV